MTTVSISLAIVLVFAVAVCFHYQPPDDIELPALRLYAKDVKQLYVGFRIGLITTLALALGTLLLRQIFPGQRKGTPSKATPEELAGVQLRAQAHRASVQIENLKKEAQSLATNSVSRARAQKESGGSPGCFEFVSSLLAPGASNGKAQASSSSAEFNGMPRKEFGGVGEWQNSSELSLTTIEEAQAIAKFHQLIDGDLQRADVDAKLNSEVRLLRFLRGNAGNVEVAAAQFRAMLNWRYENGMQKIRAEALDGRPLDIKSFDGLRDALSATDINAGCSPEGHIYHIELTGRLDVDRVMNVPDEKFQRGWFGMMELRAELLDHLSQRNKKLQKVVQIRDLSELGIQGIVRNIALMRRLKSLIRLSLENYPESIDKVVLVNVPKTFTVLWSAIAFLFNDRVKSKFYFLNDDFAEPLARIAGQGALFAIARLRRDVGEGIMFQNRKNATVSPGPFSIAAGCSAVAVGQLPAGTRLSWSFTALNKGVEFRLMFFASGLAQVAPLDIIERAKFCGETGGEYVAQTEGVVWACWSNTFGWWSQVAEVQGLVMSIAAV